ncbi:MAG: pilus assembly protein MshP [Gammaproteobacteria bacterium]|nr:pilus assembly protein MshP [Gammaproteobacteria bacterium]MCI0590567.1 pilus assembly protein MshP [Gammaproteobacteria bacterium]
MMINRSAQKGFSVVAALFLIVVLAALGAFMVTISSTQQYTATFSIEGTRGFFAAESGLEWAVKTALDTPAALNCGGAGPTFTLSGGTTNGFNINVTCAVTAVTEGAAAYSVYALTVTAARGITGSADYTSRTIRANVTDAP